MKLKCLFASCVLTTSIVPAATLFSSTESSYTPASETLANVGDSETYYIAVINDALIPWSLTNGDNNNPLGITGPQARVTLSGLSGTGSISLSTPDETPGSGNSFNVSTVGNVGEFSIRIEYLNSLGDSLGMAGRSENDNRFGPMSSARAIANFESHDVTLSMLDGNGQVIDDFAYLGIPSDAFNYAPDDATPTQGSGFITFDMESVGDIANIHRFDDSTPTDATDDLFSGTEITLTPTDGEFAEGSTWRFSFDSQILAAQGVPEPSAGLFVFLAGLLGLRRNRKSA